jgi:lactose/L-arabinose transport system substrate-binding protein
LLDLTDRLKPYFDKVDKSKWGMAVKNGRNYGVGQDTAPAALYYRADIFKQEGITKLPETWDDFRAIGRQLAKKGIKMLHMDFVNPFYLIFFTFHPLLVQQGQGFYDKDGNVLVSNANAVRAAKLMYAMVNEDGIVDTMSETRSPGFWTAVNEGKIATIPGASWFDFSLKDQGATLSGNWRVIPLPTFEKGKGYVPSIGGSTIVITNQCKNPDLAWEFIKFCGLTKEGQLAAFNGAGIFPCFLEALKDPVFDKPDPYYGGQKVSRFFADLVKGIPLFYYMQTAREDWETVDRYLSESIMKKTSVEDALDKAAVQIRDNLKVAGYNSKIIK